MHLLRIRVNPFDSYVTPGIKKVSFLIKSPVEESYHQSLRKVTFACWSGFWGLFLRSGQNKGQPNWRLVCSLLVRPAPVRRLHTWTIRTSGTRTRPLPRPRAPRPRSSDGDVCGEPPGCLPRAESSANSDRHITGLTFNAPFSSWTRNVPGSFENNWKYVPVIFENSFIF